MNSTSLYIVMFTALIISFIFDRDKTFKGLKKGWMKLSRILPGYLKLLILLSIVLLISDNLIVNYLGGESTFLGVILALLVGSITMIPGFIAYPLAGILLEKGVSYMVIAAFISTLMLVGVVTYPVEREYFGVKATIIRNSTAFVIAFIIALAAGLFYGEVF